MKLPARLLTRKKMWLIVALSVVFILLILGYVFYSFQTWESYEQRYQSQQATTKSELSSALSMPMKSLKERQQKLAKLEKLSSSTKKAQMTTCAARPLTGWQTYFNGVKTTQVNCKKTVAAVDAFIQELDTLTAYLGSEYDMAALLAPIAAQPTQPNEKTWDEVAKSWKQLNSTTVAARTDKSFDPTKKVTVTAIKGINDAWQELLAAHGAKDKARFVKARTNLAAAYISLAAINDENEKQVASLTAKLNSTYKTAF